MHQENGRYNHLAAKTSSVYKFPGSFGRPEWKIAIEMLHVCGCSESTYDAEFLHLMRGKEGSQLTSLPKISWLDQGQLERVVRLERLPAFKGLAITVESSEVSWFDLFVSFFCQSLPLTNFLRFGWRTL